MIHAKVFENFSPDINRALGMIFVSDSQQKKDEQMAQPIIEQIVKQEHIPGRGTAPKNLKTKAQLT